MFSDHQPIFFFLLFASLLTFVVVLAASLFLKEPRIRTKLFILPLVLPLLAVIYNYAIIRKDCSTFTIFSNLHWLCLMESKFRPVIVVIISGSVLISLVCLIKRVVDYRRWSLLRNISNENDTFFENVARICREVNLPELKTLIVNTQTPVCAVYGIKEKMLVISSYLIEQMEPEELKAIILHELAHVKRRDNLQFWLWSFLKDLLIFSPFAFISYLFYRNEVERDCDETARQSLEGRGIFLASALIKFVRLQQSSPVSVGMAFVKGKAVEYRIKSILQNEPKESWGFQTVSVIILLLFFSFNYLC